MNFRNTNVYSYNLENDHVDLQGYMILDKVPPSLYQEVLTWANEHLDMNNITLSISDTKGSKTLVVLQKPSIVVDGLGMCEIELRGVLKEIAHHSKVVITDSFMPVLHYSNGIHAMTMVLDREDEELTRIVSETVLPILSRSFDEIILAGVEEDIDMTMTRYFTSVEDVVSFTDESVHNIITTPFSLK